jgi:hypothetical protein
MILNGVEISAARGVRRWMRIWCIGAGGAKGGVGIFFRVLGVMFEEHHNLGKATRTIRIGWVCFIRCMVLAHDVRSYQFLSFWGDEGESGTFEKGKIMLKHS